MISIQTLCPKPIPTLSFASDPVSSSTICPCRRDRSPALADLAPKWLMPPLPCTHHRRTHKISPIYSPQTQTHWLARRRPASCSIITPFSIPLAKTLFFPAKRLDAHIQRYTGWTPRTTWLAAIMPDTRYCPPANCWSPRCDGPTWDCTLASHEMPFPRIQYPHSCIQCW